MIYQFERCLTGLGRYSFQFLEHGGSIGEIRRQSAPVGCSMTFGNFLSGSFQLWTEQSFGPIEWS